MADVPETLVERAARFHYEDTRTQDWELEHPEVRDNLVERMRRTLQDAHSEGLIYWAEEPWLIDVVRAFKPRAVLLNATSEGTYEERTAQYGPNPIYEAIPAALRAQAES